MSYAENQKVQRNRKEMNRGQNNTFEKMKQCGALIAIVSALTYFAVQTGSEIPVFALQTVKKLPQFIGTMVNGGVEAIGTSVDFVRGNIPVTGNIADVAVYASQSDSFGAMTSGVDEQNGISAAIRELFSGR